MLFGSGRLRVASLPLRGVCLGAVSLAWALLSTHSLIAATDPVARDLFEPRIRAIGRLSIPSTIFVEPIRTEELLGGHGLGAALFEGLDRGPAIGSTQVSRTLDQLWILRLESERAALPIQVDYQVIGADGSVGVLSLIGVPGESIPVYLEPSGPQRSSVGPGAVEFEGGLTLHLELGRLRLAGSYSGTLVVSLNHL